MKLNKIHIYFWVTALFVIIFRLLFFSSNDTIDINVHDTYFVIDYLAIIFILCSSLFLVGLIYFLHDRFKATLVKQLTSIHTFITISSIMIFHIGSLFLTSKDYIFDTNFSLYEFLNLVTVLGIIVQPIFILNSIFSTIRHFIKK